MFHNREDAGEQLSEKLKKYANKDVFIFALPRGGVPIGYKISQVLKAPLDVYVVRKIGAPWNPEFGVGSLAPHLLFLDEDALHSLGLSSSDLKGIIMAEQKELKRRLLLYRGSEDFPLLTGKTVILIDDGIATGVTTRAAIQGLRELKPKKLILAVPVAPADSIQKLQPLVDELICLETPPNFYAVGACYLSFPQVSDEEVITFLKLAKQNKENI